MLASKDIIYELMDCATWADRLVRSDLIKGVIVSENDYTSNFTSALRREINSRAIHGLSAHSQVLRKEIEHQTGTDGCIIFHNRSHFKVGLFEAKWPRLSTNSNCWDSLQKSTKKSHFDSQLKRQHALGNKFAIWEMFYSEEPYGSNTLFPRYGSACVWHADAFNVSSTRVQKNPWTDKELTSLLSTSMQSIATVVKAICTCHHGFPLSVDGMENQLRELRINGEVLVITLDSRPML